MLTQAKKPIIDANIAVTDLAIFMSCPRKLYVAKFLKDKKSGRTYGLGDLSGTIMHEVIASYFYEFGHYGDGWALVDRNEAILWAKKRIYQIVNKKNEQTFIGVQERKREYEKKKQIPTKVKTIAWQDYTVTQFKIYVTEQCILMFINWFKSFIEGLISNNLKKISQKYCLTVEAEKAIEALRFYEMDLEGSKKLIKVSGKPDILFTHYDQEQNEYIDIFDWKVYSVDGISDIILDKDIKDTSEQQTQLQIYRYLSAHDKKFTIPIGALTLVYITPLHLCTELKVTYNNSISREIDNSILSYLKLYVSAKDDINAWGCVFSNSCTRCPQRKLSTCPIWTEEFYNDKYTEGAKQLRWYIKEVVQTYHNATFCTRHSIKRRRSLKYRYHKLAC